MAIAVNIATALTTDADNPAKIAYNHNKITVKIKATVFPFLK